MDVKTVESSLDSLKLVKILTIKHHKLFEIWSDSIDSSN